MTSEEPRTRRTRPSVFRAVMDLVSVIRLIIEVLRYLG